MKKTISAMASAVVLASSVSADSVSTESSLANSAKESYSQPAMNDVPRQVFWGDTHLHTRLSADAYSFGTYSQTPEQALRFARGETVTAQNGMQVKLRRPLDFLVLTDHAEFLGVVSGAEDGDPAILATPLGAKLKAFFDRGHRQDAANLGMNYFLPGITGGKVANLAPGIRKTVWQEVGERADRFNDPGHFTSFIGYEYTAMPQGANMHRVVIFRDGADKTSKILPFSAVDSINAEDLWGFLENYEQKTGGSVLAIPHNSNISNGMMFNMTQHNGEPITEAYARTRMRWEPLHEMTQIKGDSESHALLSPDDEFAGYETLFPFATKPLDEANFDAAARQSLAGSYARSALKRGLDIEQGVGVNPYKFGMIGATDSHTALATAEEDNFWGKTPSANPAGQRWKNPLTHGGDGEGLSERFSNVDMEVPLNWNTAASGLAGVWARENTREALFDAMRRKEVYATTGPRITVRFFGGWDYAEDADKHYDYVDIGYTGGVPMGGDLMATKTDKPPRFIVLAAKDPDGANLDRVQVIKGWVDARGVSQEKVYDVAWSDNRKQDSDGRLALVGSTVNLENATYTNTIGAAVLSTTWIDPDFDPQLSAFYYVRVIEIPTPRWTDYDAAYFKVDLPDFIPRTTQERAYSSPIWYTP